jgi:hypothetical protein
VTVDPPCRRLRPASIAIATLALLAGPAPAWAHSGSATAAGASYEVRGLRFDPPVPGLQARVIGGDQQLRLQVPPDLPVTVLGDEGEPFLRFTATGVDVNLASPTAAVARLGPKGARPGAPRWRHLTNGHALAWHEGRLRPRPLGGAPASAQLAGDVAIPLQVAGQRVHVVGQSWYAPGPPVWPWLIPAVVIVLGTALVLLRGRAPVAAGAVLALAPLAVVATLWSMAGITLAGPHSALASAVEIGSAALLGLAGLAYLGLSGAGARLGGAVVLGTLACLEATGLLGALTHGFVLSASSPDLTRGAIALAFWAGVGMVAIAGGELAREALTVRGSR